MRGTATRLLVLVLAPWGCTGVGNGDGVTASTTVDATDGVDTAAGSDGSGTSVGGGRHHPLGFADPAMHGPATKLHAEDCRECHGTELAGGTTSVSCDTCHADGWRTDCVYCHGGKVDQTGAPPRDIDGTTETASLSFIAHSRHVSQYQHAPYDCVQCHRKPTDVLSEGHVFDETDARAEVDFSAGLSPDALWDGAGTCGSLYCHGNGLVANGSYTHDLPTPSCGGCHPFPGTENVAFAEMSGMHAFHLAEGVGCEECHDPVAVLLHVDGAKDVSISAAEFMWNAAQKSCTGTCHLRAHLAEPW